MLFRVSPPLHRPSVQVAWFLYENFTLLITLSYDLDIDMTQGTTKIRMKLLFPRSTSRETRVKWCQNAQEAFPASWLKSSSLEVYFRKPILVSEQSSS